jgi:abortive infection bacteriophage resistance protein
MLKEYNKPPLTYKQQLEQLQVRGLEIPDQQKAEHDLSKISYYRLSGYWYPFRERNNPQKQVTDTFIAGANFEDAVKLYEFDRQLRLIILNVIERLEVHLRTTLTYHLAHKYGGFCHTEPLNFHPKFEHQKWLTKLNAEAKRSSEKFIRHYRNNYENFPTLPIWMVTEIMSLGSLSICFFGLKHEDKSAISKIFGLNHKRLTDWLHKLTYIRNICAHHSRLWNKELAVRPEKIKDTEWLPPITPRTDRIFYILLILRKLMKTTAPENSWHDECNTLLEPIARDRRWQLAMGMPDDWREHPLWI